MIQIEQILCPVDFSETSQHALDHAAAIAHWYQSRLTIMHVYVNRPAMDLPPLMLEEADRERLQTTMRQMAARVPRDVAVHVSIQEAEYVHDEILAQLGATRADLTAPSKRPSSTAGRIASCCGARPRTRPI